MHYSSPSIGNSPNIARSFYPISPFGVHSQPLFEHVLIQKLQRFAHRAWWSSLVWAITRKSSIPPAFATPNPVDVCGVLFTLSNRSLGFVWGEMWFVCILCCDHIPCASVNYYKSRFSFPWEQLGFQLTTPKERKKYSSATALFRNGCVVRVWVLSKTTTMMQYEDDFHWRKWFFGKERFNCAPSIDDSQFSTFCFPHFQLAKKQKEKKNCKKTIYFSYYGTALLHNHFSPFCPFLTVFVWSPKAPCPG